MDHYVKALILFTYLKIVGTIMLFDCVLLFICCLGLLDTGSAFVNMLDMSDVNNASSLFRHDCILS